MGNIIEAYRTHKLKHVYKLLGKAGRRQEIRQEERGIRVQSEVNLCKEKYVQGYGLANWTFGYLDESDVLIT